MRSEELQQAEAFFAGAVKRFRRHVAIGGALVGFNAAFALLQIVQGSWLALLCITAAVVSHWGLGKSMDGLQFATSALYRLQRIRMLGQQVADQ